MVLKLEDMCVVLDCGLDLGPVYHFLPSTLVGSTRLSSLPGFRPKDSSMSVSSAFRQSNGRLFIDANPEVSFPDLSSVSVSQIDAVLLSNCQTMLALPFLTRQKDFRAVIYATDPTIQLGRLLMEELLEFYERMSANPKETENLWKNKESIKFLSEELGEDPRDWSKFYTREEMECCLLRVNLIAFKETVLIHGLLRVSPYSSGYCIGSVNWLIQTDYEKICYISASGAVTAHPKGLDITYLRDSDVLVLNSISENPASHPDNMVRQLCEAVASTLKSGGNVLLPCSPTGIIYDLLELVGPYIERAHGVSLDVPMYFVSPVADSALAFANIFSEWLNDTKSASVYLPEDPFIHFQQIKNGKLKSYKAVYKRLYSEFKSPCVVFAGHPTLRFGDAVHFMELWRNEQKNAVIFTDPDYPMVDAIGPFQPLAMKAFYFPIDTRLNFDQLNLLLKDLRPKEVFYCEEYSKIPAAYPAHPEFTVKWPGAVTYKFDEVKRVDFATEYKKMRLDPSLADAVNLNNFGGKISVSPLVGYLSAYDNNLELQHLQNSDKPKSKDSQVFSQKLCGKLTASALTAELKKSKIEATIEQATSPLDFRLSFPNNTGYLQVTDGTKTSINLGGCDEKFRNSVKNAIVQCLSST